MAKRSALEKINAEVLPTITQVAAPVVEGEVTNIALRRQKVRELHRQGFDAKRISMILSKGIKGRDKKPIKVPCTEDTIKNDLSYIAQEALSEDQSYLEKRAEVLDKLKYIYHQAMRQYSNAKSPSARNSFLNTAITILGKITDIEGIASPQRFDIATSSESRSFSVAQEIMKLDKEDRDALITTITNVLERTGQPQEPAGSFLLPEVPNVPASSSDDGEVSGKS